MPAFVAVFAATNCVPWAAWRLQRASTATRLCAASSECEASNRFAQSLLLASNAPAPSSHSILKNKLGDSADTLVAAARELPQLVTLCGIKPNQEAVDFSRQNLDVGDAKLLAFDLSRNQTIKSLE